MSQSSSSDGASRVTCRIATAGDLLAAARIHAAGDAEMVRRMHPLAGLAGFSEVARTEAALAALQALYDDDPRQVMVAEGQGRVVGVASAAFRGRHAHIQSLFVTPQIQERGVGRALLRGLHDAGIVAGCSIFTLQASDDPRALTRYLQLGLLPEPPNIVWTASSPRFPEPRLDNPFEPIPLAADDEAVLNTVGDIDRAIRGAQRTNDLRRWLQNGEQGTLLIDRTNERPAGYFLVSRIAGRGRVGPVAAMDQPRFGDILTLALTGASRLHERETVWRMATPGENHAAIMPLLTARFRPAFSMPFFATAPIGRFDRYAFHDLDLL